MAKKKPQPPAYDQGLAPAPAGAFQRRTRLLLGMLGPLDAYYRRTQPGALRGEAQRYVDAHTKPLIRSATDAANRRATAGMDAIGGLTAKLNASLAGMPANIEGAYDRAKGAELAAGGQIAGNLQAAGAAANEQLGTQLAGIGGDDPAVKALIDKMTSGAGAGLGAAANAGGYTGFSELNAMGAADTAAAAKMPEINTLGALRSGRLLQAQTNANLADQIGQINATAPGMLEEILQQLDAREAGKAGARQDYGAQRAGMVGGLLTDFEDREFQKSAARAGFGNDAANRNQAQDQFEADLAYRYAGLAADQAAAAAAGEDGGITPDDRTRAFFQAQEEARMMLDEFTVARPSPLLDENGKPRRNAKGQILYSAPGGLGRTTDPNAAVKVKGKMQYARARAMMRQRLQSYVDSGLVTPAQASRLIDQILRSAGIVPASKPKPKPSPLNGYAAGAAGSPTGR